jgi:hypothetical protein
MSVALACRWVQEFVPLLQVLFLRDPKPRDIGSLDMLTAGKRLHLPSDTEQAHGRIHMLEMHA